METNSLLGCKEIGRNDVEEANEGRNDVRKTSPEIITIMPKIRQAAVEQLKEVPIISMRVTNLIPHVLIFVVTSVDEKEIITTTLMQRRMAILVPKGMVAGIEQMIEEMPKGTTTEGSRQRRLGLLRKGREVRERRKGES